MRCLMTGIPGTATEEQPDSAWLTSVSWARVCQLQPLGDIFDGFSESFKGQLAGWQDVFDSVFPLEVDWPANMKARCNPLQRCLILYALRPDSLVPGLQQIVVDKLGKVFLEPPPFDLAACFQGASPGIPLVFIVASGSDPMADITRLAESMDMLSKINPISLGQGQGPKAVKGVKDGSDPDGPGKWVLLQNCHLAPSWMPTLEGLVEKLEPDKLHPEFRLWLTACPSPAFPISVLQMGVKMTLEPPKGLRNSLNRAYLGIEEEWFETCTKPTEFKKMLFGLCFFHALILERRTFGALGWNIAYQFSEPDRDISRQQLKNFLDEFEGVPWKALNYMVAEANYGGRVTDSCDRRCISSILKDFYTPKILEEDYKFSISGTYFSPGVGNLQVYLDYIKSLPLNSAPEVFWLHNNANLTAAINEGMYNLRTGVELLGSFGGGGGGGDDDDDDVKAKKPEEIYSEIAAATVEKLPKSFDIEAVMRKYPVLYDQCLNVFLHMELGKFNRLLGKVRSTSVDLQLAVKGLVVFSPELEEVSNMFLVNKTPNAWLGVSYPCLKPLSSYVVDFLQRWKFCSNWVSSGLPSVFWFTAFFFQQAFLTGVMQNYARGTKLAIDQCIWNFTVLHPSNKDPEAPQYGAYINGLFLDGARWDEDRMVLTDSFPKVLWAEMPFIWLLPTTKSEDTKPVGKIYEAPVYKESARKGVLSTSGHHSNMIMFIYVPCDWQNGEDEDFWTKRGVGLITQTDD